MIIRRHLTIVFGALPATLLCIWAVVGFGAGAMWVVEGLAALDLAMLAVGLLVLGWGSLGVYGTISLWAIGLGFTGTRWRQGLIAGIVGAFPIALFMVLSGYFDFAGVAALLAIVVAVVWLIDFHGMPKPPISDDDLERYLAELKSRGTSW